MTRIIIHYYLKQSFSVFIHEQYCQALTLYRLCVHQASQLLWMGTRMKCINYHFLYKSECETV